MRASGDPCFIGSMLVAKFVSLKARRTSHTGAEGKSKQESKSIERRLKIIFSLVYGLEVLKLISLWSRGLKDNFRDCCVTI